MRLKGLSDKRPGYVLLAALLEDFPDAEDWEPEALFSELEDSGVPTSQLLQDKLSAALVARDTDACYTDPLTFENTCTAFGNLPVIIDVLQEPRPRHMAWGVVEMSRIRKGTDRTLSTPTDDVAKYVATVLHRAGMVLAPEQLSFSQEYLEDLNHNSKLARPVRERLSAVVGKPLADVELDDTSPVDIQVGYLLEIAEYIRLRDTI